MWPVRLLSPILLLILLVTAVGGLFGPHERWWGVDIGATSASAFIAILGISIWLASRHPQRLFRDEWSLVEKNGWLGLVFTVLILLCLIALVSTIATLDAVPRTMREVPARHFISNLMTLIITWGVIAQLLRRRSSGVEKDERDLRIEYAAARGADLAFTLTVLGLAVLLGAAPFGSFDWWLAPVVLAHLVLGMLVLKALLEYALLVASYARQRA